MSGGFRSGGVYVRGGLWPVGLMSGGSMSGGVNFRGGLMYGLKLKVVNGSDV